MSINVFTPFYHSGFNPYDFDSSSDDDTYNTSISIDSEDFTEISIEEDSSNEVFGENSIEKSTYNFAWNKNYNEFSWGSDDSSDCVLNNCFASCEDEDGYVSDEKFKSMRLNAEIDFNELKIKYNKLFTHPGIKAIDPTVEYPEMDDIEMEIVVVKSIHEETHLMTSGVGPCLVIMARGHNDITGTYMALSHSAIEYAKDLLPKIRKELESKGCSRQSIEFYIVGGQLPYRDGPDVHNSEGREKEFLDLSVEFNIVGAQLYLADNLGGYLTVILSKDEIVWKLSQLQTNGNFLTLQ